MKHGIVARILISVLGAAMVLWGVSNIVLGFAGERATAVITSIRRQGGERNEAVPNRYTYSIGYEFYIDGGGKITGSTLKIGDAVYVKASGSSTAEVRYYAFFPYINTLEDDTGPGLGAAVLILAGGALVFLVNRTKKAKKRCGRNKQEA